MSIRLVRLSGRDVRDLQALAAGDAITPGAQPSSDLDSRVFIERALRLRARGVRETFAVRDDERLLGIGVLTRAGAEPDHAELGYWIGRAHRGRGHATAAAGQLLAHGFARMRLALIFARSPSANGASIRVMEKIGLRFVGVEPSGEPGGPVQRYELGREEWEARR